MPRRAKTAPPSDQPAPAVAQPSPDEAHVLERDAAEIARAVAWAETAEPSRARR